VLRSEAADYHLKVERSRSRDCSVLRSFSTVEAVSAAKQRKSV